MGNRPAPDGLEWSSENLGLVIALHSTFLTGPVSTDIILYGGMVLVEVIAIMAFILIYRARMHLAWLLLILVLAIAALSSHRFWGGIRFA